MPDRDAHFDRAVAVGGDHAVEDHEMPAHYAAAPRSMSGEPGGSFPGPGQLTDVNVPLLGKHYLLPPRPVRGRAAPGRASPTRLRRA